MEQAKNSKDDEKQLSGFPARLKEAIGAESVAAFAKRAKVTDSLVRAYLRGESQPGLKMLFALAKAAGVRAGWLLTGELPVRRIPGDDEQNVFAKLNSPHNIMMFLHRAPAYADALERGVIPEDTSLDDILSGKWDTVVLALEGRMVEKQEVDFELLAIMFRLAEQGIRDLGYAGEIHAGRLGATVSSLYRFLQWKYDDRKEQLRHAEDTREWIKSMKDMIDIKNMASPPEEPAK